ncbi:Uncharacterized protein SCG7086_CF_00060 [Chlamydiales bacterium SCGC AG-110-P3]|nr:Uncharacterized protein SCG7086_CF_00060 [Chlamydiales bacterium SCGC AG-110-P3]
MSGVKNRLLTHCYGALLDFVYPAHCSACDARIHDGAPSLCRSCAELLEMLDPSERCPTCFGEVAMEGSSCLQCSLRSPLWDGRAAVFGYRDTAAAVVRQLKYGNKPYLASAAGAYMALQATRLEWPVPDVIIPVPIPWPRRLERGYNQSRLLAEALTPLWGGSVADVLDRNAGDWSQAGLSSSQRRELTAERFHVKKGVNLSGKIVCLVDDVITTGSTLEACGELVLRNDVAALYALTLCRAEKIH